MTIIYFLLGLIDRTSHVTPRRLHAASRWRFIVGIVRYKSHTTIQEQRVCVVYVNGVTPHTFVCVNYVPLITSLPMDVCQTLYI